MPTATAQAPDAIHALFFTQTARPAPCPPGGTHHPAVSVGPLVHAILTDARKAGLLADLRRELVASPRRMAMLYMDCCKELGQYACDLKEALRGVSDDDAVSFTAVPWPGRPLCLCGSRQQAAHGTKCEAGRPASARGSTAGSPLPPSLLLLLLLRACCCAPAVAQCAAGEHLAAHYFAAGC